MRRSSCGFAYDDFLTLFVWLLPISAPIQSHEVTVVVDASLNTKKQVAWGNSIFFLELSVAQPDVCNEWGTPSGGPPIFSRAPPPNFNFLFGFRPHLFCRYGKNVFFCKILQKNVKCRLYGAPDMRWGGGHVSPVPPPGCATVNHLTFIKKVWLSQGRFIFRKRSYHCYYIERTPYTTASLILIFRKFAPPICTITWHFSYLAHPQRVALSTHITLHQHLTQLIFVYFHFPKICTSNEHLIILKFFISTRPQYPWFILASSWLNFDLPLRVEYTMLVGYSGPSP